MKFRSYFTFEKTLEALEFYKKLGAEVTVLTLASEPMFQEMEGFSLTPEQAADYVMYARFQLLGNDIACSDAFIGQAVDHTNSSLEIQVDPTNEQDLLDAKAFFAKAVEHGCQIQMPLGEVPWAPLFGIFIDPFGITWTINSLLTD